MGFYRRRLPHWHPEGVPVFLTWRLYGSLPRKVDLLTGDAAATEGRRFLAFDREMDRATAGPTWLKEARVAQCVVDTLFTGAEQWKLYELFAWVVMANHVHALVQAHQALREVTRAVKSTSARLANRILGRSGWPFWQDESYDHWVRDAREFDRVVHYIEWNPVHAGLVERVEEWPWSSASPRFQPGQVGDLPHA
jgi:REP element-mobilizing transposase RayT